MIFGFVIIITVNKVGENIHSYLKNYLYFLHYLNF